MGLILNVGMTPNAVRFEVVPMASDLDQVYRALNAVGDDDFTKEAAELEELSESSSPGLAGRFVAHVAGDRSKLVGYVSGEPSDYYSSVVDSSVRRPLGLAKVVFVDPEFRKKKAATRLMLCLVDYLADQGCTYLTLSLNGDLDDGKDARHHLATTTCGLRHLGDQIYGDDISAVRERLASKV